MLGWLKHLYFKQPLRRLQMQNNKKDQHQKPQSGTSNKTGSCGSNAPKKPEHTGSCGGDKGKKGSCG